MTYKFTIQKCVLGSLYEYLNKHGIIRKLQQSRFQIRRQPVRPLEGSAVRDGGEATLPVLQLEAFPICSVLLPFELPNCSFTSRWQFMFSLGPRNVKLSIISVQVQRIVKCAENVSNLLSATT